MIDESVLDFDEATIIAFDKIGTNIKMVFKNATYGNDFRDVQLILINVKSIETEADVTCNNCMAAEDGEIIFLELSGNMVEFGVDWNNFAEKLYFNYEYKITFDDYSIKFIDDLGG